MSTHEPSSADRAAAGSTQRVESRSAGYELRDVRVVPLALATAALFALLSASMFGMHALFRSLDARVDGDAGAHSMAGERQIPPEPRLQVEPRAELEVFQAEQARWLSTYGWIDRDAGIVRLPIERAMELTVERGLPQRGARAAVEGEGEAE